MTAAGPGTLQIAGTHGALTGPSEPMDWMLRDLMDSAGVAGRVTGDAALSGIAHDTRVVQPGDLFCCIVGERTDGHALAPDAVGRGAKALLVQRPLGLGVPEAVVDDVRARLGRIAATFYREPSSSMLLVGVTGTNGKTTVTYLVEGIGAAAGLRSGLIGNIDARLSGSPVPTNRTTNTPEAVDLQRLLAEMRDLQADVVAMEVTSEGLHKHRVDGTRFSCAAFTNLTQDHLNYHGTMESYFEAKATLFTPAHTTAAVVNVDDPWGRRLADSLGDPEFVACGADGDVRCLEADLGSDRTRMRVATPAGTVEVTSRLVGPFNVSNVLIAAGIAVSLNLPLDAVAAGVEAVEIVPGRLEPVRAGQSFVVLVDYAHTPDALEGVLGAARDLTSGRVICVFGCGGDRDRSKRPLMGRVASRLADISILTSDNPRGEDPDAIIDEIEPGARDGGGAWRRLTDRREAIAEALSEARSGDVVVIAGKGHETGQTFADRTVPFDDRVVVRELLEGMGCRA